MIGYNFSGRVTFLATTFFWLGEPLGMYREDFAQQYGKCGARSGSPQLYCRYGAA